MKKMTKSDFDLIEKKLAELKEAHESLERGKGFPGEKEVKAEVLRLIRELNGLLPGEQKAE